MAQARASADTLAKSAGVTIAGVASISESGGTLPTPIPYASRDAAGGLAAPDKAVSTPVQAGTNEVTVTVAVSYLIH